MKNLLSLIFIIISPSFFTQNFDSLIYCSIKLNHDTDRVNLFYAQGFSGRLKSPQFSYDCAKQAEYFAGRSKSVFHQGKANNLLGILFYRKGDLKKALQYHLKALELRESVNDEQGIAYSETNLGNIYSDLGKMPLAEQSYVRALQLNSKLGNDKQCGNCYVNLGVLKTNLKQFDEAERYFYNAFKIAKNTIDYELEALCLNNLSQININRNEFEAAVSNSMDALKVKELMGNEIEKADSYINLAKAFFHLNQTNQVDYYLNKADSLCRVYEYPEAKSELLHLKSFIYESKGLYNEALMNYKAFIALKDSLFQLNKEAQEENVFSENKYQSHENPHSFSFPYLMLISLIGMCVLIVYLVFINKR